MTTVYEPMNLKQISKKYNIGVKVLKKWMEQYAPDINRCRGTYIFTPNQVKDLVEKIGEFKE